MTEPHDSSHVDVPPTVVPVRTAEWHRPVVTRLSVSRTLFVVGSPVDGGTQGDDGNAEG